jgi:hypothetical protein
MPLSLPADYAERVYAGVLGKLIGVYLGRPYEGWSYARIAAELGDLSGYVHERFGQPLVVTDDDIGGTFTFLRALPDHGNRRDITPRMCASGGLAARVQGPRRYYALLLDVQSGGARLVKALNGELALAEATVPLSWQRPYALTLDVTGPRVRAWLNGAELFDVTDADGPLPGGGVALVCKEGRLTAGTVTVRPA